MIKRIAAISVSLMLSVMIVALGAGVSFVRCCHMQTMTMALISDNGHHDVAMAEGGDCCGHHDTGHGDRPEIAAPDCMKVVVVKLAPAMASYGQSPSMTAAMDGVAFTSSFSDVLRKRSLPVVVKTVYRHVSDVPHCQPRDYLRLIRVLLI